MFFVIMLVFLAIYQAKSSERTNNFLSDQNRSFECGFDQFNKKYVGFCVQYIKTALLFLLVDLEIALLLPIFVNAPLIEKTYMCRFFIIVLIMFILLLILLMEIYMGGLS